MFKKIMSLCCVFVMLLTVAGCKAEKPTNSDLGDTSNDGSTSQNSSKDDTSLKDDTTSENSSIKDSVSYYDKEEDGNDGWDKNDNSSNSSGNSSNNTSTPDESEVIGLNNKVELKKVDPLAGFKAPEKTTITYGGKTYTKAYADDISLFKYCGAWQQDEKDPHTMVKYWTQAYVEIDFTGTELLLEFSKTSHFQLKVDNGEYKTVGANGIYVVKANGSGKHTVRIYNRGNFKRIYFAGAAVPSGATLSRTPDKKRYVQLIGDSITQNNSNFLQLADDYGWDFSVTAQGAMSLRNGYGALSYFEPDLVERFGKDKVSVGMETAYFKLEFLSSSLPDVNRYVNYYEDDTLNYNFKSGKYPDTIWVFLGTNDMLDKDKLGADSKNDFAKRYNDFVGKLLKTYGKDTEIILMQALPGRPEKFYEVIEFAAKNIVKNYPNNVTFVNRQTVASWNVELSSDDLHPSEKGYKTLANAIFNRLK